MPADPSQTLKQLSSLSPPHPPPARRRPSPPPRAPSTRLLHLHCNPPHACTSASSSCVCKYCTGGSAFRKCKTQCLRMDHSAKLLVHKQMCCIPAHAMDTRPHRTPPTTRTERRGRASTRMFLVLRVGIATPPALGLHLVLAGVCNLDLRRVRHGAKEVRAERGRERKLPDGKWLHLVL